MVYLPGRQRKLIGLSRNSNLKYLDIDNNPTDWETLESMVDSPHGKMRKIMAVVYCLKPYLNY